MKIIPGEKRCGHKWNAPVHTDSSRWCDWIQHECCLPRDHAGRHASKEKYIPTAINSDYYDWGDRG